MAEVDQVERPLEESFYVAVEWLIRAYHLLFLLILSLFVRGRSNDGEYLVYWAVIVFCLWPDRLMPKSWRGIPRVRWVVCAILLSVVFVAALWGSRRMWVADQCSLVWTVTSCAGVVLYARWLRPPFTNLAWRRAWLAVLLLNAWAMLPGVNAVGKFASWLFN